MKQRVIAALIAGILAVAFVLGGCAKTTVNLAKYAQITEVVGAVTIVSADSTAEKEAKVGDVILIQDKIVTGANALITVNLGDLGVFSVRENSEVVISAMVKDEDKVDLNLTKGNVLFGLKKLARAKDTVTVTTPTAVAAVRGTAFSVIADGRSTKVSVLTGEVAVSKDGEEIAVAELKEANVSSGGAPKVGNMSRSGFSAVKEIITIKGIENVKDVGELEGNLTKLRLQIEGLGLPGSGGTDINVEANTLTPQNSKTRAKLEDDASVDSSARAGGEEEAKLIQDMGGL